MRDNTLNNINIIHLFWFLPILITPSMFISFGLRRHNRSEYLEKRADLVLSITTTISLCQYPRDLLCYPSAIWKHFRPHNSLDEQIKHPLTTLIIYSPSRPFKPYISLTENNTSNSEALYPASTHLYSVISNWDILPMTFYTKARHIDLMSNQWLIYSKP